MIVGSQCSEYISVLDNSLLS